MNTAWKYLVLACLFFISPPSSASFFEGPFQVKNLYPLLHYADQHYMEKAATENSLSLSFSHSSTITIDEADDWVINLDMEITELNFRYKRIIKDLFEFALDIPVLIMGGGFTDDFVEGFHDTFGFNNGGRENRPTNEFLYEVRRNSDLIIKGKSGTKFGDIRIAVKKPLIASERYTVSLRGDLEIPVSEAQEGYSNGSVDGGISILFDKRISERVMTYWNFGGVFPGDVRGRERIELKNFIHGSGAVEMYLGKNISAIVQLHGQSEIFPETGVGAVDGASYLIAFGGRYHKGKSSFDLSLTEDLNTTGVPDFIANLTYKLKI